VIVGRVSGLFHDGVVGCCVLLSVLFELVLIDGRVLLPLGGLDDGSGCDWVVE
jgi:hypothetical protein